MTSTGVSSVEANLPPKPTPLIDDATRVSIAMALSGTNNSLGLLRLILASLVIVNHAFPLGGYGEDPFWELSRGQASLGSIAVAGFFGISGYLIAKSGMSADVVQFLWRRTLRIFPAYWLVLLVAAFLVGPVIWVLDGNQFVDYFTFGVNGPFHYFTANWTLRIGTYGIQDLLIETTPYGQSIGGSAFNGSLWTLYYEWQCYLIIAALVAFGVLKNARIIVPMLTLFFFVLQVLAITDWASVPAVIPVLADPYLISLGFTFLLGSTLAVYSREVIYDDRLGILAGLALALSLRYGGFSTIGTVAGVYFVMYLAARLPRQLHWIGKKNDYSYGVYIYGFLVQQVLAYFGVHEWGLVPYILIAFVISFGCAWLSWHAVEKQAMLLKDWGPGRGWQHWRDRARDRFARTPSEERES
jgi:peptidoglycan/LPS O-acetylase OafA/YrhL